MIQPDPTHERFCALNIAHERVRLITDVDTAHTTKAHCHSPTCTWCESCYRAKTGRLPA